MNIRKPYIAVGALAWFFLTGLVGHLIAFTRPWMILLTPWVLYIVSFLVYTASAGKERRWHLWALFAFILTFSAEAIGTATGAIFGAYTYGDVLGPQVLAVPPVIGLNWIMICAGASALVGKTFRRLKIPARYIFFLLGALLSACLCTVFDLILEPVAVYLGYWAWEGVDIPLQNYVAWFVLSLICSSAFWLLGLSAFGSPEGGYKKTAPSAVPSHGSIYIISLFIIEIVFFGILTLFLTHLPGYALHP